ncbi:hypothetical protein J3E69DRAFT_271442 [Trichoderma sp. SZMC 28015]
MEPTRIPIITYPEASTQFQHHRIKATKCNTSCGRYQAAIPNRRENESEEIQCVGFTPNNARSRLVAIIINVHNWLHSARLSQQQQTALIRLVSLQAPPSCSCTSHHLRLGHCQLRYRFGLSLLSQRLYMHLDQQNVSSWLDGEASVQ